MLARIRMLQLTSQALPIGGYSYSNGLESAIAAGLVRDEPSLGHWLSDALQYSLGSYEVPVLRDMQEGWLAQDLPALRRLNAQFLATRESAELRSATVQMGFSMHKLLAALTDVPAFLLSTLESMPEPTLPCTWSGAAGAWQIPARDSAAAYLWSWAENQVLAAIKSMPMGQSAGQRVLLKIGEDIAAIALGDRSDENRRSNFAPGLAILCAQHETQYSRLFRS
jgi:urease accessory protein